MSYTYANQSIQPDIAPELLTALPIAMPPFVRHMGQVASKEGLGPALLQTFHHAGIELDVEGSFPDTGGLLIVSGHSQRVEPLLSVAALSAGRGEQRNSIVAMPTSLSARILQASGEVGIRQVLPVMPRKYASDRPLSGIRDRYRRSRWPGLYDLPTDTIITINHATLSLASNRISDGEAVTMCPSGATAQSDTSKWLRGIGDVIKGLTPEAMDQTHIVALQAGKLSTSRMLGTLIGHDVGFRLPGGNLRIHVRIADLGSPNGLLRGLPAGAYSSDAQCIADEAHRRYVQALRLYK